MPRRGRGGRVTGTSSVRRRKPALWSRRRARPAAKSRGARGWHALCQAMEITLVVAAAATCRGEVAGGAAATCRGEVAGGAAATCRGEVAGGACWHALCQAMKITLVVAAAGTARGEVVGGAAAACRGEVAGGAWLARALSGEGNHPCGRGGGRLPLSYGRSRRQAAGILAAVKTFDANG